MRILLVEDDPNTARSVELLMKRANIKVCATDLGKEAVDLAKLYEHDVIILDLNLPDISGHDVLRHIRRSKVQTPVLILSGSNDSQNKVLGFGNGADDYLTKPFDASELVARVHAIIRRSQGHAQSVIKTGSVEVDIDAKTVSAHGASISLTVKEYQVFELLSLRKGATITKDMFLDHLYGGMDEPEPKIIDVLVCKLRKKLSIATNGEQLIDTVWGQGYVLRKPEQTVTAA